MQMLDPSEIERLRELAPMSPVLAGSAPGHLGFGPIATPGSAFYSQEVEVTFGGRTRRVGAVHKPGHPDWQKQPARDVGKAPLVADHGPLPDKALVAVAKRAAELASASTYRTDVTSGGPAPFGPIEGPEGSKRTMNCVGFVEQLLKEEGMGLPEELAKNSRPQDLFAAVGDSVVDV